MTLVWKLESKSLHQCKKSCALLLLSAKINTHTGGLAMSSSHVEFWKFKNDISTPKWLQGIHVILTIKSLQFCGHLRVADTCTNPHTTSMQTSSFFLPKQLHMCHVALTSSISALHVTIKNLHMSILKYIFASHTMVPCSPSTATNCILLPIAPNNFVNQESAVSWKCP